MTNPILKEILRKYGRALKKLGDMSPEEKNYFRGYIDAKVEDLGMSRTHHVSDEEKIAYRDRLLKRYNLEE